MITTTFNLLSTADVDLNFIQRLEGVFGSQSAYGTDTPIPVYQVLDALGLEPAITCFLSAQQDILDISKLIGIAWVNAHSYAYTAALPGDTQVSDLMYFCGLFLQEGTAPPRFDYCGKDLTGPGLIPVSMITDVAATIQVKINTLPTVQQATIYTLVIQTTGIITDAQYNSMFGGLLIALNRPAPINDPALQIPTGTVGYTEQPISAIASNPDVFVNVTFQYASTSPVYYTAEFQNQSVNGSGNTNIAAYGNRAAVEIGNAAILASQQVTNNIGFFISQIASQIRVGIADYNQQQLSTLAPKRSRYQQFATGEPAIGSGIAAWDADGQTVMDAGLNRRAQLLRDQTYMAQFDTDFSGSLSAAELVAAEKAIQAEMLTARKAVGLALYNAVNAQFLAANTISDTLAAVMRPYLLL